MQSFESLKEELHAALNARAVHMEHDLKPNPTLEAWIQGIRHELKPYSLSDAADDAV